MHFLSLIIFFPHLSLNCRPSFFHLWWRWWSQPLSVFSTLSPSFSLSCPLSGSLMCSHCHCCRCWTWFAAFTYALPIFFFPYSTRLLALLVPLASSISLLTLTITANVGLRSLWGFFFFFDRRCRCCRLCRFCGSLLLLFLFVSTCDAKKRGKEEKTNTQWHRH